MEVNPLGMVEQLSDLEKAEFDALDKTPPPAVLAKQWREPATVGWVKRYVDTHSRWCPALRMLRRLGVIALLLIGAVLTLNIVGAVSAKSVFRAAVKEVLIEQGLIHAQNPPPKEGVAQVLP